MPHTYHEGEPATTLECGGSWLVTYGLMSRSRAFRREGSRLKPRLRGSTYESPHSKCDRPDVVIRPVCSCEGEPASYFFLSAGFFSAAGAFPVAGALAAAAAAPLAPAAGAAAAGAAPGAAAAPSAPSAGFSSSFFFAFFTTILITLTFGSPKGLRPSGQRSSSRRILIRSPRVSTLRARCSEFLRRRLLSIDIAIPFSSVGDWIILKATAERDKRAIWIVRTARCAI